MLGEDCSEVRVTSRGVEGDRALALIDVAGGRVATAKLPHRWRALLRMRAMRSSDGQAVSVKLADGRCIDCADPGFDAILSAELGREVRLAASRPEGLEFERADVDAVAAHGAASEVGFEVFPMAMGAPEGGFFDFAPIHVITTSSLDRLSQAMPGGGAEPARFRPNLVIETPDGQPFQENDWVGRRLAVGDQLRLEIMVPTPRCALPTLAHGDIPARPRTTHIVAGLNQAEVLDLGRLPCLGAYAGVAAPGRVRVGDPVSLIQA